MSNARIYASRSFSHRCVELRYIEDNEKTFQPSVGKLLMEPFEEDGICDPTLRLDANQAQSLMDSLWECGVRPTAGSGSAGALEAVERHLKDLQRLVFKDD